MLENAGLGPGLVLGYEIKVDGQSIASTRAALFEAIKALLGEWFGTSNMTYLRPQIDSLRPSDNLYLLSLQTPNEAPAREALNQAIKRMEFRIEYSSFYEERLEVVWPTGRGIIWSPGEEGYT